MDENFTHSYSQCSDDDCNICKEARLKLLKDEAKEFEKVEVKLENSLDSLQDKELQNLKQQINDYLDKCLLSVPQKQESFDVKLDPNKEIITMNVGGKIFATNSINLSQSLVLSVIAKKFEHTMNSIFIDRDPETFDCIVDFLRGNLTEKDLLNIKGDLRKRTVLLQEATFYEIPDLVNLLKFAEGNEKKNEKTCDKEHSLGTQLMLNFESLFNKKMRTVEQGSYVMDKVERYVNTGYFHTVNVGGTDFQVGRDTFKKIQSTCGPNRHYINGGQFSWFIDRNPELFSYVLRVMRNQEPHVPTSLKDKFKVECEFFGIEYDQNTFYYSIDEMSNFIRTVDSTYISRGSKAAWNSFICTPVSTQIVQYFSVKIVNPEDYNIMIGCLPGDVNCQINDIYNKTGKWYYVFSDNLYGQWKTHSSSKEKVLGINRKPRKDEILTFKLDISKKTLSMYLDTDRTEHILTDLIPSREDGYKFAIVCYQPNMEFQLVNVPSYLIQ